MSFIESDAESFLDLIAPQVTKLERSCPPAFDWAAVVGAPLASIRDTLLAYLNQLMDWAKKMEDFFWNYGGHVLGQDQWMPATDSVQDFKARIRSLHKAVQSNNTAYLKANGFLTKASPPVVDYDVLQSYVATDSIRNLLHASRGKVSVLENSLSVVIPFCPDSPGQISQMPTAQASPVSPVLRQAS